MSGAKVIGYLCVLWMAVTAIWLVLALWFGYRRLGEYQKHFKNSSCMSYGRPRFSLGPRSMLIYLGEIGCYITFPRRQISAGALSVEDLQNAPAQLKRQLVTIYLIGVASVITLLILAGIGMSGVLD